MKSTVALILVALFVASRSQDETEVNRNIDVDHYGGDTKLTSGQLQSIMIGSVVGPQSIQNAVLRRDRFERYLWPNARVPYVIDSSISNSADHLTAVMNAMNEFTTRTCITFVERTNEEDYVRFFVGQGCYSYIGRIGGPQDISIGVGCQYVGIVIHEIFHALGRYHEQSRPDRDQFVTLNTNNVEERFRSNFDAANPEQVTTQGINYDFGSVMHYGAFAFAIDRSIPTIRPLASTGATLDDLGQRDGFSQNDILHAKVLYCDGVVYGTWSQWSDFTQCSATCNGGTQVRTRTCSGSDVCDGDDLETRTCNTASCPIPASWGAWTAWSGCTEPCGLGNRMRSRQCENGNTCSGSTMQFEDCNEQACPPETPTEWTSWGSWSDCSKTCMTGERTRMRTCRNGNNCSGSDFEVEDCNANKSCSVTPTDGEWSEWSECSHTCGGGTRVRTRNCNQDGTGCLTQGESCNMDDCPKPEPELRGVANQGCYFVPTYASPLILLEGTTPDVSDNPFTRVDPVKKCGIAALKSEYTAFSVAEGYCISGTNELRVYITSRNYSYCSGGRGGFALGFYFMDVYSVFNVQSFSDSAGLTNPSPSPVPDGASKSIPSLLATVAAVGLLVIYFICM